MKSPRSGAGISSAGSSVSTTRSPRNGSSFWYPSAASRASSGPFEVEACPQPSPGVLPRATLTERPPWEDPSHPPLEDELGSRVRLEPECAFRAEAARYQRGSLTLCTGRVAALVGDRPDELRDPQRPSRRLGG